MLLKFETSTIYGNSVLYINLSITLLCGLNT
jgi:hypothetical protein